jgi:long-chain acyl-CoA synthetase
MSFVGASARTPVNLEGAAVNTFHAPIRRAARCFGAATALLDDVTGCSWSFRDIGAALPAATRILDDNAVARGERVAVLADGSPAYALAYLTIPAAGRIVVPLNTRYTRSELEAAIANCGPVLLLTDRPADEVRGLAPRICAIEAYADALRSPAAHEPAPIEPNEDDTAAIFYTGGTSDRAKGVVMTHRNKLVDALSLIAGLNLVEDDRWLVMSPMFHAAGSFNVIPCLWVGALQVFLPRFDAVAAVRAIEAHRCTITFGVPTMLHAMVDAQRDLGAEVSSLRLLGHGGAPMTEALARSVAETFPTTELCAMYGATEMAPMATIHRHQERVLGARRGRSAGRPVLGVEVQIVDDSGRALPAGVRGEIVVRGPNVTPGYWGKSDATAAALRDRAYWSGDVGEMDDDGYLYVVDRSKDIIITGGENVYGTEVEDVLAAHPAVVEAAVIGRSDPRWGEIVTAIVVLRADVDLAELEQHCRTMLANYKVPRHFEVYAGALPRTAAGKLLKRDLRAQYG